MIDKTERERLAAAIHALRPDWNLKSLLTWIEVNLTNRAYRDAAVALTWVACDPRTQTPARALEAGPWWKATQVENPTVSTITHKCPEHPDQSAWSCKPCADGVVPPDEVKERAEALRQALRARKGKR